MSFSLRSILSRYTRIDLLLLLMLLLLLLGKFALIWGYTMDDAYITIRYAQNWVNFGVLGWNINDPVPVEGYSNTLFLLLSSAAVYLGLNAIVLFKLVSMVAMLANVWLVLFFCQRLNPKLQLLAVLFYISYPGFVLWGMSGLESLVFVTFNLFALAFFIRLTERDEKITTDAVLIGLFVFLAGVTRPEGPLMGIVIGVVLVFLRLYQRNYRRFVAEALPMGLTFFTLYGVYFYCRWSYFGEIFPNTYYVKSHTGHLDVPREFLLTAALPLLIGAAGLFNRQWRLMLITITLYMAAATCLVIGAHPVISFLNRLMLTPLLLSAVMMVFGLQYLLERHPRVGKVLTVFLLVLNFALLYAGSVFSELLANTYVKRQANRAHIGEYLMQLGVKSYAMGDVGIIATVTPGVHIYDYYGLNSKKYVSAEVDRDWDKYAAWMVAQQPEAIVLPSEEKDHFQLLPGIGYNILREMDKNGHYLPGQIFEVAGDNYRYRVYLYQKNSGG